MISIHPHNKIITTEIFLDYGIIIEQDDANQKE